MTKFNQKRVNERYQPKMGDRVVISRVASKDWREFLGQSGKVIGFNGVYVVLIQFDDGNHIELHAQDALVEKVSE